MRYSAIEEASLCARNLAREFKEISKSRRKFFATAAENGGSAKRTKHKSVYVIIRDYTRGDPERIPIIALIKNPEPNRGTERSRSIWRPRTESVYIMFYRFSARYLFAFPTFSHLDSRRRPSQKVVRSLRGGAQTNNRPLLCAPHRFSDAAKPQAYF